MVKPSYLTDAGVNALVALLQDAKRNPHYNEWNADCICRFAFLEAEQNTKSLPDNLHCGLFQPGGEGIHPAMFFAQSHGAERPIDMLMRAVSSGRVSAITAKRLTAAMPGANWAAFDAEIDRMSNAK